MRRHRRTYFPLVFLTAAVGITAVPATAAATAEPGDEATGTTPADPAEPKADDTPATTTPDEPPAPEAPEAPPVTEPAIPTESHGSESPVEPSAPSAADEAPAETTPATPTPEASRREPDDDELDADVSHDVSDVSDAVVVRPIAFPVLGSVRYSNDWGACRDSCNRRHQGTDMIGVRMQPLLAAVDGTVTRIRYENAGTAGVVVSITGADGWYYNYFHVNDDTPGTDDGLAGPEWQIVPGLTVGSPVRAGQVIAYMGDSGNAETSVPHLHFEIRQPDRSPVNPYHSLVAAEERGTCTAEAELTLTPADQLSVDAVAVIPFDGGGSWVIDRDGRLWAEGTAAQVPCNIDQPATPTSVAPAPTAPVAPTAPAPTVAPAPALTPWTVQRGQSLWEITQTVYGVSDAATTAALVGVVFDSNRDVLHDPSLLDIGMNLQLPPVA